MLALPDPSPVSLCVQAQGKTLEGEPPPQREEEEVVEEVVEKGVVVEEEEQQSASARPDTEEPASAGESKESEAWTPMAAAARMAQRGEPRSVSPA